MDLTEFIAEHNADHPYELQVCHEVARTLQSSAFPAKRIKVSIRFDPVLRSFSKHKPDLTMNGKRPEGTVELLYNSLFLMQDPVNFFNEVVPHELAHVLNGVSAYKSGLEVPEHGHEWQDWLAKISSTASPSPSLPDTDFDDRAIILHSGGVLGVCACENDDRFHAYRNTGRKVGDLRKGDIECSRCGASVQLTELSEMPQKIRADLEYIQQDLQGRSA